MNASTSWSLRGALSRRARLVLAATVVVAAACLAASMLPTSQPATRSVSKSGKATLNTSHAPEGPPWIYGRADARFTVIEFADLECEYCEAYFPVLKRWIAAHPEVNWQWHHLPLNLHEPAATQLARIAECAGETGGNPAFWNTVASLYAHDHQRSAGPPANVEPASLSASMNACLKSSRPDTVIKAQTDAAAREQITATPTVRLLDNATGKMLTLPGPVEGDALLSAIDLLTAPENDVTQSGADDDASLLRRPVLDASK